MAERLSPAWKAKEDESVFSLLRDNADELRLFSEKDLLLLVDTKAVRGNPILGLYDRAARRPVTAEKMMDWEIHAKRKGRTQLFYSDDMPCSVGEIANSGFTVRWTPVPGTVLRVTAANGTKVSKGDEILVMDVMKMETPVAAPCDGTVTVMVNATDKVATGDVLAVIG